MEALRSMLDRLCFCVTEKGYVGLVGGLSKIGDRICVVEGAPVPLVLYALGSLFRFRLTLQIQTLHCSVIVKKMLIINSNLGHDIRPSSPRKKHPKATYYPTVPHLSGPVKRRRNPSLRRGSGPETPESIAGTRRIEYHFVSFDVLPRSFPLSSRLYLELILNI